MTAIQAVSLHKHFGAVRAVDGLTLAIREGEIYGLVGPDGAGKTTAMRLLCGALQATSGDMEVGGYSVRRDVERVRAEIGYLPQRFSLYEEMTVLENLRFFAEVRGLPGAQWQPRSREILDFVGLAEFTGRRAGQLSGGMKQKLGLAAALVHRPRVLLLDEPTTGVDPVTRQSFWQLIIRLVGEEGVAVLVSTPYMDEAGRCNRVGFMRDGRLMEEGTPSALCARLQDRVLEITGRPLRTLRQAALRAPQVENAQMFGDRLHVRVREGAAGAADGAVRAQANAAGAQVDRIRVVPAGLEDVFIHLLEHNA